ADVYGLGVTLYELLTGKPAFAGGDALEVLLRVCHDEPRPPRRLNPAIPVEVETVVLKAMAKEAKDRYATARELADDLERCLNDEPIRARRAPLPRRLARWARRHRPLVAGAATLLVALLLAGGGWAWSNQSEQAARRAETEREVSVALAEAETFNAEGWKQLD